MLGEGDPFRKWGGHKGGARPQFAAYNRGKKSIAVNVQTPGGKEVYRRLARNVDVIVENFRPGTVDRLGIGYDDLKKDNPGLIYGAISGFGQDGPFARRPSYDSIGMGMSGLWSRFDDLEHPRPVGPNVSDQLTSMYLVYGILGALVHRSLHGVGQRVDMSMLMANMAFMPEPVANFLAIGEIGDRYTRARRSQAYGLVAGDGLPLTVHLSAASKFWEALTRVINRPDLLEDPRFKANANRVEHYEELRVILEEAFQARGREEWLALLLAEDVPSGPINTIEEALNHPAAQHLGATQEYGTGDRAMHLVRCPVDYSETPARSYLPPPQVGEHVDEILTSLGYTEEDLAALRAEGAL
jgi:crotonobetainyl-CoA:carnitine CoA-transferase CaiB-like acyl-CoA transferase